MTTVRDACFEIMRAEGMTTIFSNPGSTEIPFLTGLPDDIRFVLALHEGSVVGIASGYALGNNTPSFVLLHTTAGLGNAVGAIATARTNRVPLVIVVGQQDRRHLSLQPFLSGQLDGLAGGYPLEVIAPVIATDVPSAIRRAAHVAGQRNGPVLVIVPMDDWDAPADPSAIAASSRSSLSPRGIPAELTELAKAMRESTAPAIIAGSGNDSAEGWSALTLLAEQLNAPVWQEAFSSRAGFPQDHPLFQGSIPADRPRIRKELAGHDVLLVIGTAALRLYPYASGPLVPDGMRLFVMTADETEANRSPAELSIIGDPATLCSALSEQLVGHGLVPQAVRPPRIGSRTAEFTLDPPALGEPMRAAHVFQLLAAAVPEETTFVVEAPSSRPAFIALVPIRRSFGYLAPAMGGLGFAMPTAIGIRLARPTHPVIGVVGDGASMYCIQSLWTAHYLHIGVVFVVLNNNGYAVMNRLAEKRTGAVPWPSFDGVSVSRIAEGMGVEAHRIEGYAELAEVLDRVVPTLTSRHEPIVLEVVIAPEKSYAS